MPPSYRLPNLLSLSRIPLGGAFILVYSDEGIVPFFAGVGIVGLALITDLLDGHLARKLDATSIDGYLLDGLGDRAVYVALLLAFHQSDEVNGALAWLLIFREVAIYAVRVIQVEWSLHLRSTRKLSLAHALFFRLWVALVLLKDGLEVFGFMANAYLVGTIGAILLAGALTSGYLSLYKTLAASITNPE